MEAQQARERRRRRQTLIGALILAIIAAGATYYVLTSQGSGTTPPASRTVVIADEFIPAGTRITDGMLSTSTIPDSPVLAFAISDPVLAVDSFAAVDISAGQPVQGNFFRSGTQAGVSVLPPGETLAPDTPNYRAVSVEAPVGRAVGGLLAAGDQIDLYVTLSPRIYDPIALGGWFDPDGGIDDAGSSSAGYFSEPTTRLVWTNLEILDADPEQSLYVLRVDDRQAEEIAHAQSIGASFTLSLRAAADDRSVEALDRGQTTNGLIDRYGFPIPIILVVPGGAPPPPIQVPPTPSPAPSP